MRAGRLLPVAAQKGIAASTAPPWQRVVQRADRPGLASGDAGEPQVLPPSRSMMRGARYANQHEYAL